jgi:hypothetical protein
VSDSGLSRSAKPLNPLFGLIVAIVFLAVLASVFTGQIKSFNLQLPFLIVLGV